MTSHGVWPVKATALFPPSLSSVADSIATGLSENFAESSCTISTPPNLTLPPYHLAGPGLTGSTRVVDVGGPLNLAPGPDFTKKYDLLAISHDVDMSPSTGFMLGAGAGPFDVVGQNSELMPNLSYGTAAVGHRSDAVRNRTHYAKITPSDTVSCGCLPHSTGFALMCNLFCSDGVIGPCLHVKAKSRTGPLNLTETIQHALKASFGDKLISLGGVFLIKSGAAKLHVMPDFPSQGFQSRADVGPWLRYFDTEFSDDEPEGPLICLSVVHSGDDGGLRLRMEHTHCFTVKGDGKDDVETAKGGHYHYDLEERKYEIEYEGWFNLADMLYRIDPPGA